MLLRAPRPDLIAVPATGLCLERLMAGPLDLSTTSVVSGSV